jgi:REP element-mobilizing transposase RayT
MPSTFLSLNYHIVFSTKNRTPSLPSDRLATVHQYLGGTINGLGGVALAVGGVADHVHALVGLRATHCLADFLREFKKSTSLWVQSHIGHPDFSWQDGRMATPHSRWVRHRVIPSAGISPNRRNTIASNRFARSWWKC